MTRLRFYREAAGLSQAEIARRLKISPSSIALVENGHRRPWPKLRTQLAQVLGIDEGELFDEQGNLREAKLAC